MDTPTLIATITACLTAIMAFARWVVRFSNTNQKRRHDEHMTQKSEHHEAMTSLQKQFIAALIANTASNVELSGKIEGIEKRIEDMVAFRERVAYRPGRD